MLMPCFGRQAPIPATLVLKGLRRQRILSVPINLSGKSARPHISAPRFLIGGGVAIAASGGGGGGGGSNGGNSGSGGGEGAVPVRAAAKAAAAARAAVLLKAAAKASPIPAKTSR